MTFPHAQSMYVVGKADVPEYGHTAVLIGTGVLLVVVVAILIAATRSRRK